MQDTLTRYLATVGSERDRANLRAILLPIVDRMSSQAHTSAALEINTGGGFTPQIGASATFNAVVKGVSVTIAGGTDMPALPTSTITAASYNIYAFFIDSASVVTAVIGTEGTTRALAKFPAFSEGKALIGYIVVTHSSTFTAGTTALDTATTVYVSPTGPFDPTVLV